MEKFTKEKKQEITETLKKHGAILPCPRCSTREFFILDGYFVQSVQTELAGAVIGGPSIPSVVAVCKNWGF